MDGNNMVSINDSDELKGFGENSLLLSNLIVRLLPDEVHPIEVALKAECFVVAIWSKQQILLGSSCRRDKAASALP